MGRKLKHFAIKLQTLISVVCTALSFILIAVNLGFIVYYQFLCYDAVKVLIGCASVYTMLHLNKSL